jgi:hypothetical protein
LKLWGMNASRLAFSLSIWILSAVIAGAADFDGDGVADEFTITREADKVAKMPGVQIVNPWQERHQIKQSPKGVGLVIRLSRAAQTFLVYDADFFTTPIWKESKSPARVITKKDRQYAGWKKKVPGLRADAVELETEAGIDILLYWDGRWRVFEPNEEP